MCVFGRTCECIARPLVVRSCSRSHARTVGGATTSNSVSEARGRVRLQVRIKSTNGILDFSSSVGEISPAATAGPEICTFFPTVAQELPAPQAGTRQSSSGEPRPATKFLQDTASRRRVRSASYLPPPDCRIRLSLPIQILDPHCLHQHLFSHASCQRTGPASWTSLPAFLAPAFPTTVTRHGAAEAGRPRPATSFPCDE